jgi:hypothetical protein
MKSASLVRLTVATVVMPLLAVAATSAFAASQTITFPPLTSFVWKGGSATLAATASSGLPVTYSVASGPCAIAGTVVTATGAGECTVNANQAGDSNFTAAPTATNSVAVLKAPQTVVVAAPLSIPFYSTASGIIPLTVTGSGSGFVSGKEYDEFAPCLLFNINGGFRLFGTRVGTCSLYFYQVGNDDYLQSPIVDVSIAITIGSQFINFEALRGRVLGDLPFDIAVAPSSLSSSVYATVNSLTPAVCTVATISLPFPVQPIIGPRPPRYEVTLISTGVCSIVATQDGNVNFTAAEPVTRSFTVFLKTPPGEIISFPPIASRPADAGSFRVLVTVPTSAFQDGLVELASLTPLTCTVSPRGPRSVFTPPSPIPHVVNPTGQAGTCVLRATSDGVINLAFPSVPVERSFEITAAAGNFNSGMTLAADTITPRVGTKITLTALVRVRRLAPNGIVSFRSAPISSITNSATPIPGCSNVFVAVLAGDPSSGVATCTTIAEAGLRRYTADEYINDAYPNQIRFAPVHMMVDAQAFGPLDYSDIWWAGAAESGWGITIAQKGLQQFNAFYVYDANGKPVWYAMSGGTWNGDYTRFSGAIYQPTGSVFSVYDARRWQAGAAVGSGTLTFSDANNAVFDYTLNGVTARKNISRFKFGASDAAPKIIVKDLWWAGEAENGWGVSIAQQDRSLFASWYTYGADGKSTWFVVSGGTWAGTIYTGELFTTTSSAWLGAQYNSAALRTQSVGTVTISFSDANNATMTYTVNGVTQSKAIMRFAF